MDQAPPSSPVTDDVRIAQIRPLIPPALLMEELPASDRARTVVSKGRADVGRVLRGDDDRLLVVVGPCSIHDPKAAREFGSLVADASEKYGDDLMIVMRVYFEKPRTTVGWKGLINDPGLDESFNINRGLREARGLLLDLAERGVPAGTEFLDTITPQFIADLVSWGAIGARTTESQVHRELASGLSMPVGFKNATDGGMQVAVDAVWAARDPHVFLSVTKQGISAIVRTQGNDRCHIILRGGQGGPNYDAESVAAALECLRTSKLPTRLMIDCSHANSGKDHRRQPAVASAIAAQLAAGNQEIFGVMLESNLVAGRQSLGNGKDLTYGQSVTDACMDWSMTEPVLDSLAQAVRKRRG